MSAAAGISEPLRIEKTIYGGDGLAHTAAGQAVLVPFALAGELVARDEPGSTPSEAGPRQGANVRVLEPSPARVAPRCLHFGVCGGCQYQMADYPAQLAMKQAVFREIFSRAGLSPPEELPVKSWASQEPYGYRNRIRLRVRREQGELQMGYNVRGRSEFLPVKMCPIAAPLLWRAAEALSAAHLRSRDVVRAFETVAEVELSCDGEEDRLQINLLCSGKQVIEPRGFAAAMKAVQALCPELAGAGVTRLDPRSGRALESLAAWGATGLSYRVGEETYWITRGGFFQVNRFLLPTLVDLVCGRRSGGLAWDLFAGVGLFARMLARGFGAVTAVEANPIACADIGRTLSRLGPQHRAVNATTLDFLRGAVLQRERPELIVLDPPRAGAGEEACRLLAQLGPAEIVYLSCDPTTLARDLEVLTGSGYCLKTVHLIDLFPQTYHLETLAVLGRDVGD